LIRPHDPNAALCGPISRHAISQNLTFRLGESLACFDSITLVRSSSIPISLFFLEFATLGQVVNDEPSGDGYSGGDTDSDNRPIRFELFEWWHWGILVVWSFFSGAGAHTLRDLARNS
jgi:hypothetical protein